jgi:hypothetical protein
MSTSKYCRTISILIDCRIPDGVTTNFTVHGTGEMICQCESTICIQMDDNDG